MTILPKDIAEKYPQGLGRQEPNNDPFLPQPEGRIKLTLNPIDMIKQLIPPKMMRMIMQGLCFGACIALCVMMAPMIIANIITKLIVG